MSAYGCCREKYSDECLFHFCLSFGFYLLPPADPPLLLAPPPLNPPPELLLLLLPELKLDEGLLVEVELLLL